MEVLDFMNAHNNWEEILTQDPYNIKVKRDGSYILLKYNQLSSDFTNDIVRECRGAIFYLNNDGKYECVCRSFDKFGNYGESYVRDIDWNTAAVEEKVDGSLIKVWYHNNEWNISTNGTIDAFSTEICDTELTFGDIFNEALGCSSVPVFMDELDTNMTYMFELVSPMSRTTIYYPETKLYYLGQRDIRTMQELKDYKPFMKDFGVLCPKEYPLKTIEECLEYVNTMTKNEEGFVIKDKHFNRIKLKSPKYLLAFHMDNNGIVTTKRIINMIKNEQIDDFLAYCPEYNEQVSNVIDNINKFASYLNIKWEEYEKLADCDQKEFALAAKHEKYSGFLFSKRQNRDMSGMDYIMTKQVKQIKNMIEEYDKNGYQFLFDDKVKACV